MCQYLPQTRSKKHLLVLLLSSTSRSLFADLSSGGEASGDGWTVAGGEENVEVRNARLTGGVGAAVTSQDAAAITAPNHCLPSKIPILLYPEKLRKGQPDPRWGRNRGPVRARRCRPHMDNHPILSRNFQHGLSEYG